MAVIPMARKLEVVTDDHAAVASVAPASIKDAIDVGERVLLVAMRRKIAADLDTGVPPHTTAPLMRQLRELDKEIRAIDAREAQEATSSGPTEDEDWQAI